MPWKERYTSSDEITVFDHEIAWPQNRQCYFGIVVDLSVAASAEGITARDIRNDQALFGLHEGLDTLSALFDEFNLKVTFAVPAIMAELLAPRLQEFHQQGHEIAALGFKHEDVGKLSRDEESQRLDLTTKTLSQAVGERPRGWFTLPRSGDPFAVGTTSEHTLDLLIDAGYTYLGNGLADDAPYYNVCDFANARCLLTLPYYYHFDDLFFLMFPGKGTGLEHADTLYANWIAEFTAQYKRGRYFHMVLHPRGVGFGHRAQLLRQFFTLAAEKTDLWNVTNYKLAQYWIETYPSKERLRLVPSIWQDYPDSLS